MIKKGERKMMTKVYVIEVINLKTNSIRYFAVSTEDIDKEDITESKELTERGKNRIGLSNKSSARIIGTKMLDINPKVFQIFINDEDEEE